MPVRSREIHALSSRIQLPVLRKLLSIMDGHHSALRHGRGWEFMDLAPYQPGDDGREIDQISQVLETLKTNPDSRRMIVSAWNVGDLPKMALEPCHAFFQLYVADGRLSLQLYQRSADMFLGVPFNIASYSLLTHMFAQQAGLEVGDFIWTGGDCHIYSNHVEQVTEQLSREPYPFPTLKLRKADSMFSYGFDDVEIVGYEHHPTIKAPVAV